MNRVNIMSFDLSIFDSETAANNGAELHLRHQETNELCYADKAEKKPVTITLEGVDGDAFTKAQFEQSKKIDRNELPKDASDEDEEDYKKAIRNACDLYARMTKSWRNITLPGDKRETPCTYENAFKLYMGFKGIRTQVGNFAGTKANFTKS